MSVLTKADGTTQNQCDGCGRVSDPLNPIDIQPYVVDDLNMGSKVKNLFCTGCAANRGAALETLTFPSESVVQSAPVSEVAAGPDEDVAPPAQ